MFYITKRENKHEVTTLRFCQTFDQLLHFWWKAIKKVDGSEYIPAMTEGCEVYSVGKHRVEFVAIPVMLGSYQSHFYAQ